MLLSKAQGQVPAGGRRARGAPGGRTRTARRRRPSRTVTRCLRAPVMRAAMETRSVDDRVASELPGALMAGGEVRRCGAAEAHPLTDARVPRREHLAPFPARQGEGRRHCALERCLPGGVWALCRRGRGHEGKRGHEREPEPCLDCTKSVHGDLPFDGFDGGLECAAPCGARDLVWSDCNGGARGVRHCHVRCWAARRGAAPAGRERVIPGEWQSEDMPGDPGANGPSGGPGGATRKGLRERRARRAPGGRLVPAAPGGRHPVRASATPCRRVNH